MTSNDNSSGNATGSQQGRWTQGKSFRKAGKASAETASASAEVQKKPEEERDQKLHKEDRVCPACYVKFDSREEYRRHLAEEAASGNLKKEPEHFMPKGDKA